MIVIIIVVVVVVVVIIVADCFSVQSEGLETFLQASFASIADR